MYEINILGSCVSRDPVEQLLELEILKIKKYISKTSIISQVSKKVEINISSPSGVDFGSRMINIDLEKTALDLVAQSKNTFLIMDFIDERLPLYNINDSYFTGSRFFLTHYKGLVEKFRVDFDITSDKGTQLFIDSLELFLTKLLNSGMNSGKIILHKAWFSRYVSQYNKLKKFPDDKQIYIHKHNLFLKKAYAKFVDLIPTCKVIECPAEVVIADSEHKWGEDPYHYIKAYNLEFNRQLVSILENSEHYYEKIEKNDIAHRRENIRLVPFGGYDLQEKRDPIIRNYGLDTIYLTHEKEFVAKFRDTGVVFDDNGVPWNNFRWGGPYRYSVTIGHHGLSEVSRYQKSKTKEYLESAIKVADWLVKNQEEDGSWRIQFEHDWFPPRVQKISSPWVSAMGQGLCISFLSRLSYCLNTEQKSYQALKMLFIDAALKAIKPYKVNTNVGGVRQIIFDTYVFYEEYPTIPSSCVLNGFMYSLLGLYDLWLFTNDVQSFNLYKEGIKSLAFLLKFYDLGSATSYDLTHITCPGFPPNVARQSYHFIHVQLLSALNFIEKGVFETFVERWYLYLKGWSAKTN